MPSKEVKLDEKDFKILRALQSDAGQSLKGLVKSLKIPEKTMRRRIKRLEDAMVIKKYTAVLDPEKVGLPSLAYVFMRLEQLPLEEGEELPVEKIPKVLGKFDEVMEVQCLAGDYDLLVKVRGVNEKALGGWIRKNFKALKGIQRLNTMIVFFTGKETLELKL